MKKLLCSLLIIAGCSLFSVGAQEAETKELQEFSSIVDFDTTLETLARAAKEGRLEEYTDYYIIDGTVLSRAVLVAEEEEYLAQIEIGQGQWIGLDDVEMYKAVVLLSGSEFSKRVPARRSRRTNPEEITLNGRVLVAVRVLGYTETADGYLPALEALSIRLMK